jgi:hypothetical protein
MVVARCVEPSMGGAVVGRKDLSRGHGLQILKAGIERTCVPLSWLYGLVGCGWQVCTQVKPHYPSTA